MRFSLQVVALAIVLAVVNVAEARDLAEILRQGVQNNPEIMEAQANEAVSRATLDQSRAALYPKVQATASQPMLSTQGGYKFTPGLAAQWTVYDFGKTRASIKADEIETQYYRHKITETADTWANTIAGYYLEALQAKLQLQAARENLALHNHIVDQLRIINQYDPGRRSELTQAESRQVRVQDNIVVYERNLGLNLRKIARYVHPAVSASELADPFANVSVHDLISQYPADENQINQNASLLAQEQELLKNQANLTVAEKARYPSVQVQAQANKDDAAMYLTMSVDVFDKSKTPAIAEQKYRIAAAEAKVAQMQQELSEKAELAVIEMQKYQNQITIAERQIMALQQVVVDYEDQFKLGTRTLLNVVDAYSELATAKQSKVNSEYQMMKAKLDYLSAVGALGKWAQIPLLYENPKEQASPPVVEPTPPENLITVAPSDGGVASIDNMPLTLTSLDDSGDALNSVPNPNAISVKAAKSMQSRKRNNKTFVSVDEAGDLILTTQPTN